MITDFRSLCAELLGALADQWVGDERPDPDIVIRARAALAAPQQYVPSPSERAGYIATKHQAAHTQSTWRGPATAPPVAVAERLPEEGDCLVQNTGPDGEPEWWCWFYRPGLEGVAEWRWSTTPRISEWYGWQGVTHWLPHWALPLPEAQA